MKGELELNVVFPGLCCDMLFVVANIGSDGLLGTEALQSCLPHQLDLRTGQLYMGNQQWFSTMDLASGYWQVAMSPDVKRKAAFVTNEGLFQFRVMPFGLCNVLATFERLMDRVLCGMRWSRCLVYLDDVISFSGTITKALARLEEVLGHLSNFGLQLKAKKCVTNWGKTGLGLGERPARPTTAY